MLPVNADTYDKPEIDVFSRLNASGYVIGAELC